MLRLPRLTYLYPSALLHLLWTFTGGLFNAKSRLEIALLGYEASWFRSPIPVISLGEIVGECGALTLLEVNAASGNTTILEQVALMRLCEKLAPTSIFELGTFDGRSALNLIAHAADNAHLYTLDLPREQIEETKFAVDLGERAFIEKSESGRRFLGTTYESRITSLYGDSATFDFSPYEGKMDMVFVDASHVYDYVRCDTLSALKMLRPSGGLVVWHDYSRDWPGVIRALNEFYRSGRLRDLKRIESTTLVILEMGADKRLA